MRHEVICDSAPVANTNVIHLEKAGVQQKIKCFSSPGFSGVLVATHAGQHLGTGSEAW